MIVDFEIYNVKGSLSMDTGTWYIDAPITSGNIEKKRHDSKEHILLEANFDGIIGHYESGRTEPFCGYIMGEISKDMLTLDATLVDTIEGGSYDFIAHSR